MIISLKDKSLEEAYEILKDGDIVYIKDENGEYEWIHLILGKIQIRNFTLYENKHDYIYCNICTVFQSESHSYWNENIIVNSCLYRSFINKVEIIR